MRQIKFRAKDLEGHWICGYYTQGYIHVDNSWRDGDQGEWWGIPVDENTVGQFTGLTDKNGKEIYEGDVVLFTWFSYGEYELETEYQGSIDFLNGSFLFCCEHGNYPLSELEFDSESDIEVIGNIHDNPELLTK